MASQKLNGEQFAQLQSALLSAFPSHSRLAQMTRIQFDQNVNVIAGEDDLATVVFHIIRLAEAEGWVDDLVRKAWEHNPGNPDLHSFAERFLQTGIIGHDRDKAKGSIGDNTWSIEGIERPPDIVEHCHYLTQIEGTQQQTPTKRNAPLLSCTSQDYNVSSFCSEDRHLLLPPDAPYDPDWYVRRAQQEDTALDNLNRPGISAIIWGPRKCGKTWLLQRLMRRLAEPSAEPCHVVSLDFGALPKSITSSPELLFNEIANEILDELNAPELWLTQAWNRPGSPQRKLSWMIETKVLPQYPGRFIVAIDRADALLGSAVQDDLISLLRSWVVKTSSGWPQLRLILAVSTTPSQLTDGQTFSPFNITAPINMSDFNDDQLMALADRHRLPWGEADFMELQSFIGGHPYLSHLAMYASLKHGKNVTELFAESDHMNSVFAKHLRETLNFVHSQQDMEDAICRILSNSKVFIPINTEYRLYEAGLLLKTGNRYQVRYKLYEDFFRAKLCQMI